jgi:uncharacterized protein
MLQITLTQARRRAIQAQHLHDALPATPAGLHRAFQMLRCVQLDPISAVARSQVLVLRNRTAHAHINALNADFDTLHYGERRVFEYWAHCASLVLTEDFPIHRQRMQGYVKPNLLSTTWATRTHSWVQDNDALRKQILRALKKHGPLPSNYFEDTAVRNYSGSGWNSGRNVDRMLSYLWLSGVVMVAGRTGMNRIWDLAERVLPDWTPRKTRADKALTRDAALHALRALGVGTLKHIKNHFVRDHYAELPARLDELQKSGEIIPLEISGLPGTYFAPADSADTMLDESATTRLLSPFDNLICDRTRTESLFDFNFRIEIYVPAHKRKYGYYVLPILHGDRIIGRMSPAYDRATQVLTIERIFAEPSASRAPAVARAIRAEIEQLGAFLGATSIKIGTTPPEWKALSR